MNHDPLCYMSEGKWDGGCQCDLIARVRKDERVRLNTPWWSSEYHRGYAQGYDDAKSVQRG